MIYSAAKLRPDAFSGLNIIAIGLVSNQVNIISHMPKAVHTITNVHTYNFRHFVFMAASGNMNIYLACIINTASRKAVPVAITHPVECSFTHPKVNKCFETRNARHNHRACV